MSARAVINVNRLRYKAREALIAELQRQGAATLGVWRIVLRLERLAIKCGVERVLARRRTP